MLITYEVKYHVQVNISTDAHSPVSQLEDAQRQIAAIVANNERDVEFTIKEVIFK